MKNLIVLIALISSTSFTAFASTDPVLKEIALIENAAVTVTVSASDAALFTTAEFTGENLVFETVDDISFIQIFNEQGDMEFQLPVMTNKVQIGKSLIDQGNYKLGFMIEGSTDIHFTDVSVK